MISNTILMQTINGVRRQVDRWREIPDQNQWRVDPGDRPLASALAASPIQWYSPIFLPGGSSRNRDIAD